MEFRIIGAWLVSIAFVFLKQLFQNKKIKSRLSLIRECSRLKTVAIIILYGKKENNLVVYKSYLINREIIKRKCKKKFKNVMKIKQKNRI